jgi:predicted DCC family thiol-disulfide oxidoreductase YuxK
MEQSPAASSPLTVMYDGSCPLCRREISLYRRLSERDSRTRVCFADISHENVAPPAGVSRDQLMTRFHIQRPDGSWASGARAFVELWSILPGWRWLARAARAPGALWLMERAYRVFLRCRPRLQRWVARLDRAENGT